jgi:hypothetical protein
LGFHQETTFGESKASFKDARSIAESFAHSERYLRLDSDEENPDIIVLGFQELDLSAEALIYSTSTEREDSWCMYVLRITPVEIIVKMNTQGCFRCLGGKSNPL